MSKALDEASAKVPTDPRASARLRRHIELGELEEVTAALPGRPRYLVTFMKSETGGRTRSATIVTVTNQAPRPNLVTVTWFKGFTDNSSPVGTAAMIIPPDFSVDFGSRNLPGELTVVNAIPAPELTFDEGRAIVSSRLPEIGVSARVYYTGGDGDEQLLAITDSKVVVFENGNLGD
ncbi:MAG: hypothetical protein ACM3ML_20500 [Micromonosporaceae bacterium]